MLRGKFCINFGLALIFLVVPAVLWAVRGPHIFFQKTAHDFGDIRAGDVVETVFYVANKGDAFLNIDAVRTSCGCTKASIGNQEIPPGHSSDISVSYNSSGLRSGKKTQTVFVQSNDSKSQVVKLHIFANITQ
ncbi:MAG: DUF1573 domain-containing protein [Pseudomonadota bacterium]